MELNRKNMRNILIVVVIAILLFWGLQHLSTVSYFFNTIFGILTPFLLGLCIAFILNVPMKVIENNIFPANAKDKKAIYKKFKRPVSLLLTIIFVLAIIILVMLIVIPEVVRTFGILRTGIPNFILRIQELYNELIARLHELMPGITTAKINWADINKTVFGFLQNGTTSLLGFTVNIATSIFSGVLNFVLGFIFAIYILIQKESLARQVKRVLYAYLPETKADRLLYILRLSNKTFSNFITGQCLEAVILGTMFFITMLIFRLPYALMVGVLIAFTALIPLFGAFIGLFVGTFLILVSSPIKALWFIILFFVLQQIEGNLIYPRVVGNSVGLPAIWVLVAVTLFGSTFGIIGMLVSVPIFSVLYTLLREDVYPKLKEKKISSEKLE
ncbi:AI-2E family transporter [Clostridium arbusti]|uniref:AI-2E family transporter n=1 Tax=Clostridium arbusti TaxID=1137848 RepID=UPI0002891F01|nr:AI-2E family transporter [Clostridium arbusti]